MAQIYSLIGTAGQIGNLDQTLVAAKIEAVAQQMFPIDRVITVVDKAARTGRTTSVVQAGSQTLADLAENGSTGMGEVTAAFTTTARSIVQTAKGRDIFITLLANETGTGPDESEVVDVLTKAYFKNRMTNLMALASTDPGGLNLIGVAGTAPTYGNHFLPAFQRLAVGQVGGAKNWILPATHISAVGQEAQFSEWQKLGQAWLDQNIATEGGWLGIAPWGVGCWFSTDYASSGGADYGMMLAQSAVKMEIVMGAKVSISSEDYGVGDSALKIGFRTIYGINGTRDTAGTNAGVVAILG